MKRPFLHEHSDFETICEAARDETKASIQVVEKDYWIMHVIWSLVKSGYHFELKGGTSLSKGWGVINRFSEDVDIHVHPPSGLKVHTGKNHDKPRHRKSRASFFDWLVNHIEVPGAISIERDVEWEDEKTRNCGIKIEYQARFPVEPSIKPFVLLEVGFAQVEPNGPVTISSWVSEIAAKANLEIEDNRATEVRCYFPEYTFVEKLEAISRKYKREQEQNLLPSNFIRHYYDVYKLLGLERVQKFIGSKEYLEHRSEMFPGEEIGSLMTDDAFLLSDVETKRRYEAEYNSKAPMYYRDRPSFEDILKGIKKHLDKL
ncbi:MAG: nucleotidyl transferase AbiEii/AbiGii toxin family protein [Bdellovibrionales bacterium]|nr:nucleotidyl transferase AbiEii/AbiGii toxin family protein [Bdellovibrionales bacterium]